MKDIQNKDSKEESALDGRVAEEVVVDEVSSERERRSSSFVSRVWDGLDVT